MGIFGRAFIIFFFYLSSIKLFSTRFTISLLCNSCSCCLFNCFERLSGKDHKAIVIDEVAGAWLSFLFLPILGTYDFSSSEWQRDSYLAACFLFVLFRFFDIFKPHPISFIDRKFKSGFGVVLDDLVAAIFAGLTLLGGNFFIQIF